MKVLHICTGWPLSFSGGITNYVRSIAEEQNRNGIETYVLGKPDSVSFEFNYINYASKKIIPFTYSKLEDKDALNTIKALLEKEKFDIIHIHAIEYIDWDLYEIVKPYKYIVSLHDYCFICPRVYMYHDGKVCESYNEEKCQRCISYLERISIIRKGYNYLNRKLNRNWKPLYIKQNITKIRYDKFVNQLLNNADYILPVSTKVEEIFRKSGVTSRSKVLHIGNKSANEFVEAFKYSDDNHKLKIVFLGRLSEYKGADLFLKIAKHYKENERIEFHFLGKAGSYVDTLKENGVINKGPYNPKDLSEILNDYDMGMVLSIWHDNGPQVVMELLNNHIPVIGTKMGGISDFVNSENGFIFDPYDEDEVLKLYDFIDRLTTKKVYEMKKCIKRTTTPEEHYNDLMNVYNEVLLK